MGLKKIFVPASMLSPTLLCVVSADHKDLILPNTNDDKCPAYWDGVVMPPKLSRLNLLLSRLRFSPVVRRVTTVDSFDDGLRTAAKPLNG